MSTTVTYKGATLTTAENQTRTLKTAGKYLEGDIVIEDVTAGGGGNPVATENDVNFIDYDGTIRYSFTASEFADLESLPAHPSHTGLTAQGWNWALSDAKAYVQLYGGHEIGENYITDDGRTRLFLGMGMAELLITLNVYVSGTIIVDWGDGSPSESITGSSLSTKVSISHQYVSGGEKIISIAVQTGIFRFNNTDGSHMVEAARASLLFNRGLITQIQLGNGYAFRGNDFQYNESLKTITIPRTEIGDASHVFSHCSDLSAIVVPPGASPSTSSYFGDSFAFGCSSLEHISLPRDVKRFGQYFLYQCTHLRRVCITDDITGSSYYGYGLYGDSALRELLGFNYFWINTANGCSSLKRFGLLDAINACTSTTLDSTFYNCNSLETLRITRATAIRNSGLRALTNLQELRFDMANPPTVNSSLDMSSLNSECVILVPFDGLSSYLTATNYPNPSSYRYMGTGVFDSNVALPQMDASNTYNVTWYATVADAKSQTNPIALGNGGRIYCRYVTA